MPENSLLITVGADVGGAMSGLNQVHQKVGDLGDTSTKASGGITSLISPMTLLAGGAVAVGAGLFDAVGKAGDFDQKMAGIRATMQPTGAEMDKLKGLALDLGKANDVGSVSASDAADAISILGKAGISADAQLAGVTKSTLQLAAAAGPEFGVAKSAELAADSLNSFGLKAADSTSVVNTLVGAANASSIGLEDLKFGLSAVGSVAHTVGLTFQDTSAALAVFGANGLKGADAGTSLKTMLLNLQPHTKAQQTAMQDLGLWTAKTGSAFFDAQGHVKSLAEISETLKDSLYGLSDAQKISALQTMFGTDAIRAASILSREGANGISDMANAMEKQGDAAKVAADMSNNLKGKWESFQGTIETLEIQIGSALVPALGMVTDALNGAVGGFMSWASSGHALQDVMSFLGANLPIVAGVATTLGIALLATVVPALGAAAVAAWALVAPILAAAAPFIALGAAVALVVLAFQNNFLGLRDFVVPIWNGILKELSRFWTEIQPQLTEAWNAISSTVVNAWNTFAPMVMNGLAALASAWTNDWGGIRTIITTVWNIIKTTVQTVWALVSGFIKTGLQVLSGDWKGAWETIKSTLKTVWDNMGTLLGQAIELVKALITKALPLIIGKLGEWGGAFLNWITKDVLPTLPVKLGEIATAVWTFITTTALPTIVAKLKEWGTAFLNWVTTEVLPKLGTELGKIATAMWAWITATAKDALANAVEIGKSLLDGIINGLAGLATALFNKLKEEIGAAIDNIKGFLGIHSPSTYAAQHIGIPIGEGIIAGVALALQNLASTMNTAIDQAVQAVSIPGAIDLLGNLAHLPGHGVGDLPPVGGRHDYLGGVTMSDFLSAVTSGGSGGGSGGGGNNVHVSVYLDSQEISSSLAMRQRVRTDD